MTEAMSATQETLFAGVDLTAEQLLRELFDPSLPESGPTRETRIPALPSTDRIGASELPRIRAKLKQTEAWNKKDAQEQRSALRTQLLQAKEGLREILQALDQLIGEGGLPSLEDATRHLRTRAKTLKTTYETNRIEIEARQSAILQGVANLQVFFDAARESTRFQIYWLNQSAEAIRIAAKSSTGRHPILDAGTEDEGGGQHALLTRLEDVRASRLRASLIVLGDPLKTESQASFWASEGYARKIPVIAGIDPVRFNPLNEDTVIHAKKDLCGEDEKFAYLALIANHIIPGRPNTPRDLLASGAFAYAGVWSRGGKVGATDITPDGGRLSGTASLPLIHNWMTLENQAPFIWLVSTTAAGGEYERTHVNSNTSARAGVRNSYITDAIAFSYLTRTIQHKLLTRAAGGAIDEETAKRVGNEIARSLNNLTRGPNAILKDAHIELEYADVQPHPDSGAPRQVHKLSVKFPGSAEDFLVQLEIVNRRKSREGK